MNSVAAPARTVAQAVRRNWRFFLPSWLFPVAFFWSVLLPAFQHHPFTFLCLVAAPVFALAGSLARRPLKSGAVTQPQYIILVFVAPFAFWVCVVGGLWAFVLVVRSHAI
jgi:hypothetical protein